MKILITGASRGIGYEIAKHLAKDPNHNILVLGRSVEALAKLKKEIDLSPRVGTFSYLEFDLNRSPQNLLEDAIQKMGGLDICINNAGLLIKKPFEELSEVDWQQSFDTNLFAVVKLTRLVLPFLKNSAKAHMVNIGSMGGFQGSSKFSGLAAYSASKAALANLTECLAEEFAPFKIAVNCLSLGAVQTEMLAEAFPDYKAPVDSDSMGGFIAWFATQGSLFFNGKILPVSLSTP